MRTKVPFISGIIAVIAAGLSLLPLPANAVPSYARQIGKPCTGCHTMWPNLNQYGRQFKVKAYTDVDPQWEMINKDNMNIMKVFPLSARVLMYPQIREDNNNPSAPAGTSLGTPNKGQEATNFDQVAIFLATRFADYAGIFTAAEADSDATTNATFAVPTLKVAFQLPLGGGGSAAQSGGSSMQGGTLGIVAFKGVSTAADPFNSLGGRDRDLSWQAESVPYILDTGWTFKSDNGDNVGAVAHGYFFGYRLYAAIGSMRGGTADNIANGTNQASTDPNDQYYRLAWDQKLPNGAVTIGAHYYDGKQRISLMPGGGPIPMPYDTKVKRTYIDLSLEQNFGEDHLFEVQALFGKGKESNVYGGDEDRSFKGSYIQASYFYDRQYGVIASVNGVTYEDTLIAEPDGSSGLDKKQSWLVSVDYLPWLNAKLALQYASTKTTWLDPSIGDQTDKISRFVIDILF